MEFIADLSAWEELLTVFKNQVGAYHESGKQSWWDVVAGRPVRMHADWVELEAERCFSWERLPETLRVAIADYYDSTAPGYPISSAAKDLQYFFWGDEFTLHMWEDVVGAKQNPSVNGITLAGWPTFRDWLIREEPGEAALLGSKIHTFSDKGKRELDDPLAYLKSLQASKDTYLYAGYALWRLQRVVQTGALEQEQRDLWFSGNFGWWG